MKNKPKPVKKPKLAASRHVPDIPVCEECGKRAPVSLQTGLCRRCDELHD